MNFPFHIGGVEDGVCNTYNVYRENEFAYVEIGHYYVLGYNEEKHYYSYGCSQRTVFVEVSVVEHMINFMWRKISSNHGCYYEGVPRNEKGREFLNKLGWEQIELHTLIAMVMNVPNPNNFPFVDHVLNPLENRTGSLCWSATKPYAVVDEDVEEYPRDVDVGARNIEGIDWDVDGFFKVSHPLLREVSWETEKSSHVSNQDKFEQAVKKVAELDEEYLKQFPEKSKWHQDELMEAMAEYEDEGDHMINGPPM
jgi:hypothetical protein